MSVYFDSAATAIPDADCYRAGLDAALDYPGNPSSIHKSGKEAAEKLEESRASCARVLGVKSKTVIFTSGGTEANQIPLFSLLTRSAPGSFAVSAIEHASITAQTAILESAGWKKIVLPVTSDGIIDVEHAITLLKDDTAYISVMAVNNETGAIQEVEKLASLVLHRSRGKKRPHFHVDAVQAAGKILFNYSAEGIDSISISTHKLGGPKGSGILIAHRQFDSFFKGGEQEGGKRPGTENIGAAVSTAYALEKNLSNLEESRRLAQKISNYIIETLNTIPGFSIVPETRLPSDCRFSPWIIQCSQSRFPGEVLVRLLSEKGVYISTGSACSSRKTKRPVLEAMRLPPHIMQNAFRISFGPTATHNDADVLVETLRSCTRV